MEKWDLKTIFLQAVKKNGGFVNCHGHFDKAFYITKDKLHKSMVDMEQKWLMSDDIKRKSTPLEVETRIKTALEIMIAQGVKQCVSFVDAYSAVGHKNIESALKIKKEYKNKIKFLIATQPLDGLVDKKARDLYEAITARADIAGGLPSKDRPRDNKNFDYLFSIARNLNKPIHIHIDQENNPNERDTEKLIKYTKKYNYEGRTVAVHSISVSAQPKKYRQKIYHQMAKAQIPVIVCPSASLGMRQLDKFNSPIHNSIGNVPEMITAGMTVGLGVDNIYDFYQPFIDGDMWVEMRMLQEACRFYDFEELIKIATINGRKILNIK